MKSPDTLSQELWRNRAFMLFWCGRTISFLGTVITSVLLPILIYRTTGSALQTSLLGAVEVVPYLCFGLFAGALADRVNRKAMMVICDLANAMLLGSIPLAALFHTLTIGQIFAIGLLAATTAVWFDAANFGAVPTLVGREYIIVANSYLTSTDNMALIVGPSLAGVLAAAFSPALAISFDAISYLLSALSLLLIARAFNTARQQSTVGGSLVCKTFADIGEGLHFLLRQPLVRTMTLLGFGNSFTGGAVTSLLVVYGVQALHLSKSDARLGLLFTAGALGALCASLVLPHLIKRVVVGRLMLITLCLTPLLLLGVALTSHIVVSLFLYGLWNACYSLTIINGISLRQLVTPDHLLSRVNATARMVAWGGTPFGAAIGGLLAQITTIRIAYLVMALGVTISAFMGWFSPLRTAHTPQTAPLNEA